MLHLYNGENNTDTSSGGEVSMRCCSKFHITEPNIESPQNMLATIINVISKSPEDQQSFSAVPLSEKKRPSFNSQCLSRTFSSCCDIVLGLF